MIRKSTQVAMGGISSGLCLLFMMMTMMIPFSTFLFPILAGMVLISVAYENGLKTAWMVYIAVSILSVMLVPDKEAAMLFIGFFGYYPILKPSLDKFRNRFIQMFLKMLVFNGAIVVTYTIIIYIFGLADILDNVQILGKYTMVVMIVMLNFLFIMVDKTIAKMIYAYIYWFRPKFLRKVK